MVTSFELKRTSPIRLRVSLYEETATEGIFRIPKEITISSWIAPSGIIGPVELLPIPAGGDGCYRLHETSLEGLRKLGYGATNDIKVNDKNVENNKEDVLEDGFFEVETVLERRISKDTQMYEYKVRFKDYGEEDDMWLPASSFNRSVNFVSTSRYGRKRHHALVAEKENEDKTVSLKKKKGIENLKKEPATKGSCKKENDGLPTKTSRKTARKRSPIIKQQKKKSKGGLYRRLIPEHVRHDSSSGSNLESMRQQMSKKLVEESEEFDQNQKAAHSSITPAIRCSTIGKGISILSENNETTPLSTAKRTDVESVDHTVARKENFVDSSELFFVDESTIPFDSIAKQDHIFVGHAKKVNNPGSQFFNLTYKNPSSLSNRFGSSVRDDLLRGTDELETSREELQQVHLPLTNANFAAFDIVSLSQNQECLNPLELSQIPPLRIVNASEKALRQAHNDNVSNAAVLIGGLGVFDRESLTIIRQYHRLKDIQKDIVFERDWIKDAFIKESEANRKMVESAFFNNQCGQKKFIVSRKGSRVNSQVLSTFCGERYLSDESINILLDHYCSKANEFERKTSFVALPAHLSNTRTADAVRAATIRRRFLNIDMNEVEYIFVPIHLQDLMHWGLGVICLNENVVNYDDGFHLPKSTNLVKVCNQIIQVLKEMPHSKIKGPASQPFHFERLNPPMPSQNLGPYQKHGQGSCGVAVILCARDLCERRKDFNWSFNESHFHRAELMVELAKLAC